MEETLNECNFLMRDVRDLKTCRRACMMEETLKGRDPLTKDVRDLK